jgi:hypothetical protein
MKPRWAVELKKNGKTQHVLLFSNLDTMLMSCLRSRAAGYIPKTVTIPKN